MEHFQGFGSEGFEKIMENTTRWNKNNQAVLAEIAGYNTRLFEQGSAAFDKAVKADSIEKAFEVQTEFAKSSMDSMLEEMNKLGDMMSSAWKDSLVPAPAKTGKK
jgi:hypothetical protein